MAEDSRKRQQAACAKAEASRPQSKWGGALVVLVLWLMGCQGMAQEVLRNAAEVRRLTPGEAERGLPVELQGVVTFFDPGQFSRFVQDGTAGIYLTEFTGYPDLKPGDEIRVTGKTASGEYAPVVQPLTVEITGRRAMPQARVVALEDLTSGREDSQWVEVRGVVRRISRTEGAGDSGQGFDLAMGGGRLRIETGRWVPDERLVDCEVRVRGVCSSSFNRGRQLFRSRLLVSEPEELTVLSQPPAGAWDQAVQPLAGLLRFAPQGSRGHRVKVQGTVLHQVPEGPVFIGDGAHGVLVESSLTEKLEPGDLVEALGFPGPGEYTPVLEDALWRRAGSGPALEPVKAAVDDLLRGELDCRLVALEGRLLDRTARGGLPGLVMETNGVIWTVRLDRGVGFSSQDLPGNGSRLRVTGICQVDVGPDWKAGEDWRARGFHLLARSPADLEVLEQPPWWTLTRLLWVAVLLLTAVLAALTWAGLLRRQVRQQTEIIRRQLVSEAGLRERYQTLIDNADDLVYTQDADGFLTSINPAGAAVLQRTAGELTGQRLTDFMLPDQQAAAARWTADLLAGSAPGAADWDFRLPDGGTRRLEIRAALIKGQDGPVEVEGIGRDVTEQRRLEREVLEISTREQRRMAHDLHDGICQQLAGLAFLADLLAERLEAGQVEGAEEARRISDAVTQVNNQTRHVARGLFPAALEENGLVSALEELAAHASAFFNTRCLFTCPSTLTIRDEIMAHHLFYIAQEAMLNAARHARPSQIQVRLEPEEDRFALTIEDDGQGLPVEPAAADHMGLRIMRYRARQIGADLEIKSQPGKGTRVRCLFQPDTFREGRA